MNKTTGGGVAPRLLHLRSFLNQVFLLYFLENIYHFLLQHSTMEFDGTADSEQKQTKHVGKEVIFAVHLNGSIMRMNPGGPQLNAQPQRKDDRDDRIDFEGFLLMSMPQRDEYLSFCLHFNVLLVCYQGDRSAGRYPWLSKSVFFRPHSSARAGREGFWEHNLVHEAYQNAPKPRSSTPDPFKPSVSTPC